jgi:hypothetical protein
MIDASRIENVGGNIGVNISSDINSVASTSLDLVNIRARPLMTLTYLVMLSTDSVPEAWLGTTGTISMLAWPDSGSNC